MGHSFPYTAMLCFSLKNVHPRKYKHKDAQDGGCGYKHEEEPIIALQPEKDPRKVNKFSRSISKKRMKIELFCLAPERHHFAVALSIKFI